MQGGIYKSEKKKQEHIFFMLHSEAFIHEFCYNHNSQACHEKAYSCKESFSCCIGLVYLKGIQSDFN